MAIDEFKKAAKALYAREQKDLAVKRLVLVLQWETDAKDGTVTLDERWLEYTGQTLAQTRHGGWMDPIYPDDRANTSKIFANALANPHEFEVEYRIRKYDGEYRWFLVKQIPVRDENGEVTQWFGAALDIHDRKMADIALRDSRVQLKTFNESLEKLVEERTYALKKQQVLLRESEKIGQVGSWEWNLDRGEALWSDELYRIHGLELTSEIISLDYYLNRFVYPKDRDKVKNHMETVLGKQSVESLEFRIITPIGEKVVLSQLQAVKEKKKSIRGIIKDITAQKEAEKQLVKLKLEQQRKILNTILITQETERERIGEGLHNGIGQLLYAAKIKQEMIKVVDKVNANLLAEANKILGEAIEDVRNLSFQLVPSVLKDFGLPIAISSMIQRLVTPTLKIDFDQESLKKRFSKKVEFGLYRIVQELLNNCIKHADATEIRVKLEASGRSLILEVQDNGKGFDPKNISELRKGIGLQSVQNRAKMLNASLHISSFKGKGTCFKVELCNP